MMRALILIAAFVGTAPAFAQSGETGASAAPHAMHAPAAPIAAASAACPPEHAAMGHCKPAAAEATVTPAAAPVDPKCPPEHAAMGHCKPATAEAAPPSPPAALADPCPPEHAAMGHCKPAAANSGAAKEPPKAGPSAVALGGPAYAADGIWGAEAMKPSRTAVYAEHGGMTASKLLLDRFEYRGHGGAYAWEGEAWTGGDYDRLWLKSEGEGTSGELESAEVQALWSHALDPWFNLQGGVRYDIRPRPGRAYLALGVQGLARYWFEVDVAAFLSDRGDLTARAMAEYDQRLTNKLIVQPHVEIDVAAQNVPSARMGAGLSKIESGLRVRYEFVPEFAPYLGVVYERNIGKTADFARAAGERVGGWSFVTGLRIWL